MTAPTAWHAAAAADVVERLGVDPVAGLSPEEAARRLAESGPNELEDRGGKGPWRIAAEQFTALLVVVLLVAAGISLALGDLKNAIAILAIVLLNAAFGFVQEHRAERAMASLKRMSAPLVRVRRSGLVETVPSRELVAGDIVLLEAGNIAPADGRLVVATNLRVQESALTGESEPVDKDATLVADRTAALGDRRSMVYTGTVVTYGRGEAVVVDTGMRTELGRIAALMRAATHDLTPLQRRLAGLARQLATVALFIVLAIALLGLARGEPFRDVFMIAVSMAVAAVPEGLPAVVTIALALGAQRMLRRRALVRQLVAVETLGSVTVICTDKTGTLTENRMAVTLLDVAEREPIEPGAHQDPGTAFQLLVAAGALCNDAVVNVKDDGGIEVIGDPTDTAFVTGASRCGIPRTALDVALPRIGDVPFESERKRMTTVHRVDDLDAPALAPFAVFLRAAEAFALPDSAEAFALHASGDTGARDDASRTAHNAKASAERPSLVITKGAVDRLLEVCDTVWADDRIEPLDEGWRARISAANDRSASRGMRVLGVAMKTLRGTLPNAASLESRLTFLGLVGLIDPPRREAKAAIDVCRSAGIRTVMITGDHPLTAVSIARDLGIDARSAAVTGPELSQSGEAELDAMVEQSSVYARVAPEHKLRIVRALQRHGHIVAMTGDGVNDAPALKQADIGVAMGITGTDVAKDAARMVLLDDNFATIVAAVQEGRVIYDNIRKFISFLVASNSAELWVMLVAPLLGMPVPLLPLQILWINLVTDGPAALALGVEPAEANAMRRPPYRTDDPLFSRAMAWHVVWVGALMAAVSLATEVLYWRGADTTWQTMIFTTLALSQMANVLATRSTRQSLWTIGLLSNKPLLAAVGATVVLQFAVIYVPFLQSIFSTVPLSGVDLALAFALSSVVFFAVEARKWVARRKAESAGR